MKTLAIKYSPRNRILPFILISLLLHVLFLLIYGVSTHFSLFPATSAVRSPKEKEIAFEFVETPKASPTKPRTARLLSDKNSTAQNRVKLGQKGKMPSARGTLPSPDAARLAASSQPVSRPRPSAAKNASKAEKNLAPRKLAYSSRQMTYETFSPEKLTGGSAPPRSASPTTYENESFNVDKLGGLAFNTYEWDFAPYMLYLKKKIQQHIFPPPAFTKLGLIQGHTLLRFRIYPDGHLGNVTLLSYKGHKSLMETSLNAVNISAPFKPLPKDFPKDFLEVTGSFWYIVKK